MNHHDPADERWQRLADAELCGELLAPHEREFLAGHQASDPAVRVEQQLRRALADHGREDLVDPEADDRLISAALAQVLTGPAHAFTPPTTAPPRRRAGLWLGAGVLLAASLALIWTVRSPTAAPPPALTVLTGAPAIDAAPAGPGDSFTPDHVLATADAPACVGAPGRVRACLGPHSRARIVDDGALELLAGDITVDITPAPEVTQFILQVAGVRLTGEDAAFTVSVTTTTWTAASTRGTVTVSDPAGPLARLGAGDRLSRGEPPPVPKDSPPATPAAPAEPVPTDSPEQPVPTDSPDLAPAPGEASGKAARPTAQSAPSSTPSSAVSAAELLAEAREHRAAGRAREAIKAYQRLISTHPGSPLAGTAQLALGQLYLGPAADAKAALRAFDRYLEQGGPLAEEAAHGRISALTRLGREADARAAIERFLARYPASSYADALRRQTDR